MFKLTYTCDNCNNKISARVNGNIIPPPVVCDRCMSPSGKKLERSSRRRKREPGQIHKGLQIRSRAVAKGEWVVECLWCKDEPFLIGGTNIGNQDSCGCFRMNKLSVNFWHVKEGLVNCTCKDCHLTKDYDLTEDEPIFCANGCQDVRNSM